MSANNYFSIKMFDKIIAKINRYNFGPILVAMMGGVTDCLITIKFHPLEIDGEMLTNV